MSDLDQLDRALDALTRDLAHAPGPGAGAAMGTARTRRRTRAGAVALAALVVVGGGLTIPRMLSASTDDVAADGAEAPLDAGALEQATQGWLAGWEQWTPNAPQGGGSFSVPACLSGGASGAEQPQIGGGLSRFLGDEFAYASAEFAEYPDARTAEVAQDGSFAICRGATTMTIDGTDVRHYAEPSADVGTAITDVWTVRIGAERLTLEIAGRAGVAPETAVERVAQAVVAGLRSGAVQEQSSGDPNAVGDRAMVMAVSGAAEPMPGGVADDVAGVMDDWLHLPWD
jgi:hypothetical protein